MVTDAQLANLETALAGLEAALDELEPNAGPDLVVARLAEPVRAFDIAAKEALA